jgi:predicted nucleic acid-binding protein
LATGDVSESLQALGRQWAMDGERFVAPNFLGYEFSNAVYKLIRRGVEPSLAPQAFEAMRRIGIDFVDCSDLHEEAIELSRKYGMRATYDAHYLALSAKFDIDMYTCDRTLFNSLRGEWPRVHVVEQRTTGPSNAKGPSPSNGL